jgi:tellurite resistance protein TehA-like permease
MKLFFIAKAIFLSLIPAVIFYFGLYVAESFLEDSPVEQNIFLLVVLGVSLLSYALLLVSVYRVKTQEWYHPAYWAFAFAPLVCLFLSFALYFSLYPS